MAVNKNENTKVIYTSFYYIDGNGIKRRHKKEGFKTKTAAKAYEVDFLSKQVHDINMPFENLVVEYLKDRKVRTKPTTFLNKKYIINSKISPFFKGMTLSSIEPKTIRNWQNNLLASKKTYSQTYLRTINNNLTAIFNYAVKFYKLPSNPATVCGKIGTKNAESMQFWTLEEYNKFIIEFSDNLICKVIFELFFFTGIRLGECLSLSLSSFDFEKKALTIKHNYARHEGEDLILDPKTKKSKRVIAIPEFLCTLVKEYADKLYDYEPNERLFNVSKNFIYKQKKLGCKKSGVKNIRVHDLRYHNLYKIQTFERKASNLAVS
jgi:integrase